MSVTDIFNFIEIDSNIATSGQPSAAQFRDARAAGYEAVVNLAPDGLETSLPDEAGLLRDLGIEYHHIPVVWADPRPEQLEAFEATMQALAGRKTLVHCQANYRVTAFFALFALAKLEWSDEQADALIARIWNATPGAMDETWQAFIASARARA